MRPSSRLTRRRLIREDDWAESVPEQRRFPPRWAFVLGAVLVLAIVVVIVAAARNSSGDSLESVVLAGDSVAVIDPRTDTIVGEIPVGDRPAGPAVGKGSVWVGNRDDNTLLRIDPGSLDVVRTIGLGMAPIDVDVGAVGVRVLSDQVLLRVDPATNDVVDTIPLPPAIGAGSWNRLEVGANAVFVCSCASPGKHRPRQPCHEVSRDHTQKSSPRLGVHVWPRCVVGDHRMGAEHHRTDSY